MTKAKRNQQVKRLAMAALLACGTHGLLAMDPNDDDCLHPMRSSAARLVAASSSSSSFHRPVAAARYGSSSQPAAAASYSSSSQPAAAASYSSSSQTAAAASSSSSSWPAATTRSSSSSRPAAASSSQPAAACSFSSISAAAASASTVAPSAILESELVMAYRLDYMNPQEPLFFGLDLAEDLARQIKIGAEVYTLKDEDFSGDYPVEIEPLTEFNARYLRRNLAYRLLMKDKSFSVLGRCDEEEEIEYLETHRNGPSSPYRDCQEPGDPIATDADSLISSLYFMKRSRFPRENELAGLRCRTVFSLTTAQIEQRLEALKQDLLSNAPDRPMQDGRFPGCGPRVNILLQNDTPFMSAWARAMTQPPVKPAQPAMALASLQGMEMDAEDPELQAAIERSMADQGKGPATE